MVFEAQVWRQIQSPLITKQCKRNKSQPDQLPFSYLPSALCTKLSNSADGQIIIKVTEIDFDASNK